MSQALRIYVSSLTPPWRALLLQCGLWCEPLPSLETVRDGDASLILLNEPISDEERTWFLQWSRRGGGLLDIGDQLRRHRGNPSFHRFHRAGREEAQLFPQIWALELYSEALTFPAPSLWGGTVSLASEGKGAIGTLGFDPAALWMDPRRARKRFYRHEGHSPNEVVSLVSKAALSHLLLGCLRWLHEQQGLPLARLGPFPFGARSVFTMRMDSDYGSPSDLHRSMERASRYGVKQTWFLHLAPLADKLRQLSRSTSHEFALHGWDHETYPDFEDNLRHLRRGKEAMEEAGLPCVGVAAPFGIWNLGWQRAVAELGFQYSSEFSFANDGFPIRPALEEGPPSPLQLPVHPICPGSLMRIGVNPDESFQYFQRVLSRKLAFEEPASFYHHPLHEIPALEESLYRCAEERGLPCLTYAEWCQWWTQRSSQRWSAHWEESQLTVRGLTDSIPLQLERGEQRATLHASCATKELSWRKHTVSPEHIVPEDWQRARESRIDLVEHCMQDLFHLRRQGCDTEGHRRVAVDIGEWTLDFEPAATAFEGF